MSSNADLFTALQMLDKSVTQFATTRAVNDANEQVQQIHENYTDESQKVQGLRDVASGLTRRLATLGMDPGAVTQIAGSIVPPKTPPVQNALEGLLAGYDVNNPKHQPLIRKATQGYIDSQNQMKLLLQDKKNSGAEAKDNAKNYLGIIKDFGKDHKDLIEGYTKLELTPEDLTNPLNFANAKRASIKASGDNKISDADFRSANVDKSLWAKINSFVTGASSGEEFKGNADLMKALAEVARVRSGKALHDRINSAAENAINFGKDPEEARTAILNRYLGGPGNFNGFMNAAHPSVQGTTVIPAGTPGAGTAPAPKTLPPGFRQ